MNELQRIRNEGLLPDAFFNEEKQCDFLVTKNQKAVWAIEIDLLLQIDRFCKKYGLKYFLIFGSLLGAVRHGGFIPWDDDMDVCMPREDYEFLLSKGDEFKYPYFLQTPLTDNGFYYAHAKLRNSNTTAYDYPFIYQGFNQGIFIDVLPIDKFDPIDGEDRFKKINELILNNSVAMRLSHPNLSEKDKERVKNYPGGDPLARYNLIQTMAMQDKEKNIDTVSLLVATTYGMSRDLFQESDFDEMMEIDFAGIKTYVPCGYDNILKTIYGDYMKLPDKEVRGKWHSNITFYPEKPYTEFLL